MTYRKALALSLLLYSITHLPQKLNADAAAAAAADASPKVSKPGEEANKTVSELVHQTSPSPSPVQGNSNLDFGDAKIDAKKTPPTGKETCELASNQCHDVVNVIACVLPYAGDGPMVLHVLNEGDDSINFNVTPIPLVHNYKHFHVSGHEFRKINVYGLASSTSSIVLKAVNWTCTIKLSVPVTVPVPKGFSFPSYAVYMTPVNGTYVLLATAFLIGIMWAICCKLGNKNKRHLDGVPYQELEMGQPQERSTSSADVETDAAWDRDWDDDWDDDKAARSSHSGNRVENRRANGR